MCALGRLDRNVVVCWLGGICCLVPLLSLVSKLKLIVSAYLDPTSTGSQAAAQSPILADTATLHLYLLLRDDDLSSA